MQFNFLIIIPMYLLMPSVMEIHHDNHHTLLYFYIQGTNILWVIRGIPLDKTHLIHGLYEAACVRTKSCPPHRTPFVAREQRYKPRDTHVICYLSYTDIPSESGF